MFTRLWKGWQMTRSKPEPPEIKEAKEKAHEVRVELLQASMRQQRVVRDVRQELAKIALEAVARG